MWFEAYWGLELCSCSPPPIQWIWPVNPADDKKCHHDKPQVTLMEQPSGAIWGSVSCSSILRHADWQSWGSNCWSSDEWTTRSTSEPQPHPEKMNTFDFKKQLNTMFKFEHDPLLIKEKMNSNPDCPTQLSLFKWQVQTWVQGSVTTSEFCLAYRIWNNLLTQSVFSVKSVLRYHLLGQTLHLVPLPLWL